MKEESRLGLNIKYEVSLEKPIDHNEPPISQTTVNTYQNIDSNDDSI